MSTGCILFHKSVEQMRLIGTRGGRISARNRRARLRDREGQPAPADAGPEKDTETTAEAIALLHSRFPWLRGVERRARRRVST